VVAAVVAVVVAGGVEGAAEVTGMGASVTVTTGGRLNPPPLTTSRVIAPMNHEAAEAAHCPAESIPCAARGFRKMRLPNIHPLSFLATGMLAST